MPYFLRGKCVVKGTKENPGETVKCHNTVGQAKAHLRALYANVEDAVLKCVHDIEGAALQLRDMDLLSYGDFHSIVNGVRSADQLFDIMSAVTSRYDDMGKDISIDSLLSGGHYVGYKSMDVSKDRWIAISTREEWDRTDEMFTTEAMDFDIRACRNLNDMPEFRMYHVRGFKLGMCDDMARSKDRAVDQGWWHKTAFSQAVKDIVIKYPKRWKISRGFYSLEATGQCRRCSKDLLVRPINYTMGIVCPKCKTYHPKASLKRLKHLKAKTFDISVTDAPAVASTAVAAYSIQSS